MRVRVRVHSVGDNKGEAATLVVCPILHAETVDPQSATCSPAYRENSHMQTCQVTTEDEAAVLQPNMLMTSDPEPG